MGTESDLIDWQNKESRKSTKAALMWFGLILTWCLGVFLFVKIHKAEMAGTEIPFPEIFGLVGLVGGIAVMAVSPLIASELIGFFTEKHEDDDSSELDYSQHSSREYDKS